MSTCLDIFGADCRSVVFNILVTFAGFEVDLLRMRIRENMAVRTGPDSR